MAVEDKYANSDLQDGKLANPALICGADTLSIVMELEVAAADDNGSIYRIGKALGANLIPVSITINNDAITSGTDYDLGLYKVNSVVKDKDIFADGVSMASARVMGSGVSGLTALNIADMGKKIYEYAGDSIDDKQSAYDLVLTANTVGTVAGTILVTAIFAQG